MKIYDYPDYEERPSRRYFAEVETPEEGKALAEAILRHEDGEWQWGNELRWPRLGVYYETIPSSPFRGEACVYRVGEIVTVAVRVVFPKEIPYEVPS